MSFSDFYATGTVTVPAGGTAVVGAGTLWSTPIVAGDTLEAGGRAVRILDVVDNTHLTLAYGWPGAALAGSSYIIVYNAPSRTTGAYVAERLRELIERQRILDDGVPTYVAKGAGTNAPPSAPAASDLYLVGSAPTGAWAGYGGYLAVATDAGAWRFTAPAQGMRLYDTATDATWERHAAGWVNISPVPTSALGAANGVATLDSGGKVPAAQLPALAITETFPVASQAAMLALTAQAGDVAIRSDIRKSFILSASPATTLANWLEILAPLGAVSSVAGRTGDVTLGTADVSGLDASLAGKLTTGTRSMCIPAAAFTPRTTSGAAWGLVETAANKRMVRTLDFDPGTAEYAQICIPMPKSWNEGTFTARLIWQPGDGAVGNVRWAVRAACVDYYDGTDNLDRAWGTAVAVATATSGMSTATCYTDITTVTPAGTPANNALLFVEIFRDAADAADTYGADAKLVAVYVNVTLDAVNDA
ncbi:DUF2793 domain-containing protein [Xanthobacter sp.]|uniref:DUF2793 domain-containing protein n=1 Tax=Xanthobacter sp. TaxID=35809 RepID=UPI0025E530A9|nr:DUF2793 domain-containing protein [Xanthobacter sp.]